MPDTTCMRDIETMTLAERREHFIRYDVALEYSEKRFEDALRELISLRLELAMRRDVDTERNKRADAALKLLSNMGIKEPCDAYHLEHSKAVCWGTKECDPCSCGGDKTRCTHYPKSG